MEDRSIVLMNIERFRQLLEERLDEKTRRTVLQLLNEARADLAALEKETQKPA